MLASAGNGEPLPAEHGSPARMVIPGLPGYVSACTWLAGIETATYEAVDAYRDRAAEGPITTASRIDVPVPVRPSTGGVPDRDERARTPRAAAPTARPTGEQP